MTLTEPAVRLSARVRFVQGDMKDLGAHFAAGRFGLVVPLFNSFGYFVRRSDDTAMLRAVLRVLRPGGALVINTLNRAGVARRLKQPLTLAYEPVPNVHVTDASRYDRRRKRTQAEWTIVDARRRKPRIIRRAAGQYVYSHADLRRLLTATGFRIETIWGRGRATGSMRRRPGIRPSWRASRCGSRRRDRQSCRYSALMPASRMIGHHFSTSAL